MHNSTPGTEYFVQKDDETASTVNVVAMTNYLSASPQFNTTTLTVNPYQDSPGVRDLTAQIDDRVPLRLDGVAYHVCELARRELRGVHLLERQPPAVQARPELHAERLCTCQVHGRVLVEGKDGSVLVPRRGPGHDCSPS